MGFCYLLIKRINLGIGFLLEESDFYNRMKWCEIDDKQLNEKSRLWFNKINSKIDNEDYVEASAGFLMGMLNACSTTMGLVAISGINVQNTIVRSLRSSDDSMTVFVADSIQNLAKLISLIYSVYRLFGINPSKEKTILFPEGYATTLQLLRTQIINAFGAISRLIIGCDNVRRLWNVKKIEYQNLRASDEMRFLTDGGKNPWVIENIGVDEATIEDIIFDDEEENNKRIILFCVKNIASKNMLKSTIQHSSRVQSDLSSFTPYMALTNKASL
ncbi:unnamed protein product [Arctia plantaginis]|uniref:RdRp catalytic domain-containing protein n=1 Tax=Arctia plantaginis TaxID=874455 RepID=A0A8S0ZGD4_ARCPL|nr:unnamed protein product [Arctia plantaginis]